MKLNCNRREVEILRITKSKLDLALARQCKSLTDLRGEFAPKTLVKINNGEELRTKTVGQLARLLKCDPADLISENEV